MLAGFLWVVGIGAAALFIKRWWFWQVTPMAAYPDVSLICWGHRGSPMAAPENSVPSFEAAIDAGADGIELDVMLSADGVVVVRHDFDLERTTDGAGWVDETTFEDLSKLNVAHYWTGLKPHRVPRLEDVLEILPERMLINIELKPNRWLSTGVEDKVVAAVRQFGLVGRTVISSFNPYWLLRVRRLEKGLSIGYIWWDVDVPWYMGRPTFMNLLRPEFVHPRYDLVSPELIARAHRHGTKVNVWTVNNRPLIAHLKSMGVDGIFTDFPELIQTVE